MIVRTQVEDRTRRIAEATQKAAFANFRHGAASIRIGAARRIRRRRAASPEGQPPHTRRGLLRRALRFDVDDDGAVIGPRASFVGESAAAHEFGETYRGTDYPERPFMLPALEEAAPRFADSWKGSIGE